MLFAERHPNAARQAAMAAGGLKYSSEATATFGRYNLGDAVGFDLVFSIADSRRIKGLDKPFRAHPPPPSPCVNPPTRSVWIYFGSGKQIVLLQSIVKRVSCYEIEISVIDQSSINDSYIYIYPILLRINMFLFFSDVRCLLTNYVYVKYNHVL